MNKKWLKPTILFWFWFLEKCVFICNFLKVACKTLKKLEFSFRKYMYNHIIHTYNNAVIYMRGCWVHDFELITSPLLACPSFIMGNLDCMLSEFSSKTYLHTRGHSSNIHNNQGVEASKRPSPDGWIRSNVVHTESGLLLSLRKDGKPARLEHRGIWKTLCWVK